MGLAWARPRLRWQVEEDEQRKAKTAGRDHVVEAQTQTRQASPEKDWKLPSAASRLQEKEEDTKDNTETRSVDLSDGSVRPKPG